MSDQTQEVIISDMTDLPETDMYEIPFDEKMEKAAFDSSTLDIVAEVGKPDFMYIWNVMSENIKYTSVRRQLIFSEQILDKIFEVYDYIFPEKLSLDTKHDLNKFYEFIEFLEFNNVYFIKEVWKFLGVKSIIELDIDKYCKNNSDKIIKEIEEQLDIHPQSKYITLFLKSYYREKFIEWFAIHSRRNFIEIQIVLEEKNE